MSDRTPLAAPTQLNSRALCRTGLAALPAYPGGQQLHAAGSIMCRLALLSLVLMAGSGCGKKSSLQPAPAASTVHQTREQDELETRSGPRPDRIDRELTMERRQRIEHKLPEVRGFLVQSELEERMKNDRRIDRREKALEIFDEMARGRWVLFVGPINNPDGEGFELPVAFLRESRRDKMEVTRLWFNVVLSEIKGYAPVLARAGQETAVVARYQGEMRAGPGYDLVGLGLW